jgi:5-methylcytosine-specific restriction endonuclease McrA
MTTISISSLSDHELLERTVRLAGDERYVTADLLALIGECDTRRLYLGEGCSSLFTYCTQVLHFSEHAAYHRIEGARAARQFPIILELIAEGSVTLTTVALLRPHLTIANHEQLLTAARHCSKREVEHQIACLAPKPAAKALIRRLAATTSEQNAASPNVLASQRPVAISAAPPAEVLASVLLAQSPSRAIPLAAAEPRAQVAALASDRYLLRVTLAAETIARLRRAQELMRHTIPDGNPAAIIDKALSLLVAQLERTKLAHARRPRAGSSRTSASAGGSRHIPAAMRREVWARDAGRCAFVGARGRCTETGRLEFHHIIPFARGGPTSVENLGLRCRSHNGYESDQSFGRRTEGNRPIVLN